MKNTTTLDDLVLGYAAGRLPDAIRFLIGNHIELSPGSARLASVCEHVGGAMMHDLHPTPLRPGMIDDVFSAIDGDVWARATVDLVQDHDLPTLLRARLGRPVEELEWREFSGVAEYEIAPRDEDGHNIKLIKVKAGRAVPQHTHDGDELTLILRGAFDDITGRYERGDLAIADHDVDHRPVADSREDCLCLAVTSAPIRLSGTLTRFLNPFLRF